MDSNKKEILTNESIKKDLKQHFFHQLSELIFTPIFAIFGFFLFKSILCIFLNINEKVANFFLVLYVCIISLLFIHNFVIIIKSLYLISKNKYEITIDWVVNKLPKNSFPNGFLNSFFYRSYTLNFAKSGEYHIPSYQNYKWSDWFSMFDKNVYEKTSLNDEFYLISIGKRKNIIAYNKKWFELLKN